MSQNLENITLKVLRGLAQKTDLSLEEIAFSVIGLSDFGYIKDIKIESIQKAFCQFRKDLGILKENSSNKIDKDTYEHIQQIKCIEFPFKYSKLYFDEQKPNDESKRPKLSLLQIHKAFNQLYLLGYLKINSIEEDLKNNSGDKNNQSEHMKLGHADSLPQGAGDESQKKNQSAPSSQSSSITTKIDESLKGFMKDYFSKDIKDHGSRGFSIISIRNKACSFFQLSHESQDNVNVISKAIGKLIEISCKVEDYNIDVYYFVCSQEYWKQESKKEDMWNIFLSILRIHKLDYLSKSEISISLIQRGCIKFQEDIGITQTGKLDKLTQAALEDAENFISLFTCLKEYKKEKNIHSIRENTLFRQSRISNSLNFCQRLPCMRLHRLSPWHDLEQLRRSVLQLNAKGYIDSTKINHYSEIEEACKQFQEDMSLKIDGILGPKTQGALRKSTFLSLFFAPNINLRNMRSIEIINRNRKVILRFYLIFLISFLGIVLCWPFLPILIKKITTIIQIFIDPFVRLCNIITNIISTFFSVFIKQIPHLSKILVSLSDILHTSNSPGLIIQPPAPISKDLASVSQLPGAISFKGENILLTFLNVSPILFIISFISERAIEILLTYAFSWDKKAINKQIEFYDDLSNFLSDNENVLSDTRNVYVNNVSSEQYSKQTIMEVAQKIRKLEKVTNDTKKLSTNIAYIASFSIGILSAFAGFRVLEPLSVIDIDNANQYQLYLFRWLDIVLTSVLVSGGSEVAHRLYKGTIDFSIFTQLVQGGADNVANVVANLPRPRFNRPSSGSKDTDKP